MASTPSSVRSGFMTDEPIASFKISQDSTMGKLHVYADRIERTKQTPFRRNAGSDVTPFNRISSVDTKRHIGRHEVSIYVAGRTLTMRVYDDVDRMVQLLNDGIAGRLGAPAAAAPPSQGPPAGWYADPSGQPAQRWWDGAQWTEHTQPAVSRA